MIFGKLKRGLNTTKPSTDDDNMHMHYASIVYDACAIFEMSMKRRHWGVVAVIALTLGALLISLFLFIRDPVVLQPSGDVGIRQRDLFYFALGIMSLVALPVFGLLGYIAWRYRETNTKARYTPRWDGNRKLETIWWGIPIAIVCILSVVAWQTSHSLDPYRPLDDSKAPLKVQVVALRWKWLFLYPDQSVASVNQLTIPVNTPVSFEIASDAPMNSFWIPELGGQIYAMNGMKTRLHLIADKVGEFKGVSSNISGEGFADMKFTVRSVSDADFAKWSEDFTNNPDALHLDMMSYEQLALPSIIPEPQYYHLHDTKLYQMIIDKYSMSHSMNQQEEGGMH